MAPREWTGLGGAGIVIGADASGVTEGVAKAEKAMAGLGDSVDNQSKNLNRYGEKLGKAFGPGQGLHGRLDSLEMPLRDTEGAFDRAQMAMISFGNEGATASDKIGSGFLLAGDAIAAFTSGGAVGIAIVAAVAGFSLLTSVMGGEAEAAKKSEEAQKKHAEELANVGKAAVEAGISIAALQAKEVAGVALSQVLAVEQERLDERLKQRKLKDQLADLRARESLAKSAFGKEGTQALQRQMKEKAAVLAAQDLVVKGMKNKLGFAKTEAKQAQAFYLNDLHLSSGSAVTAFANATKKMTLDAAAAIMKTGEDARAAAAKIAEESKKDIFDEAAFERQVIVDNKHFDISEARDTAAIKLEIAKEERKESESFEAFKRKASVDLANFQISNARKVQESFMKNNSAQIAAFNAIIGGVTRMAHDGELSFKALADAALMAAGQELIAKGTVHLMAGVANMFATLGVHGGPEAAQGGAMIAAGIGMGAVGGAIGRSGASAGAASQASAPTDTRESRAATGSSEGGGGTTIINFNGPAYDKRGVAQVITSGQRMAKHRRIAGA
jgi:hypothetical protein